MIPDNVLYECLDFLDYCELYGKEIKARDVDPLRNGSFIPHLQRWTLYFYSYLGQGLGFYLCLVKITRPPLYSISEGFDGEP